MHVDAFGVIRSVNGTARDHAMPDATPSINEDVAAGMALAANAYPSAEVAGSELVYVIATADDQPYLAWEVIVRSGDITLERTYVDAHAGNIVDRRPEFFTARNLTELDPIVPSYHHLCDAWSKTLCTNFYIEADESKALAHTKPLLMTFSDPELAEHHQDYYGAGYSYPLKVTDITPVSSDGNRGVQFADIVAGAHAHFGTRLSLRTVLDPYVSALRDVILAKGLPILTLWPSTDVTPQALEADGPMSSDPVEYAGRILARDPATRRPISV